MAGRPTVRNVGPVIEVHALTRRYGDVSAVRNVSFRLEPGVLHGILGPAGAGKSTTLRLMVGLERVTSGRCLFDGRSYRDLAYPLREVGVLLAPPPAHPGRTGRDHLRILARTHGIPDRRTDEVLELTGLADVARLRAGVYSPGLRQRLGLAGALLGDAPALLLDDPAAGLDPDGVAWLRALLRTLAREGRAVLVTGRLTGELARDIDRLIILGRGRVLADAPAAEVIARNTVPAVWVRPDRPGDLEKLLRGHGAAVALRPDGRLEITGLTSADIAGLAARAGILLIENTPVHACLNDVYLALARGR
ncbi:ATP-binding cassette domain-containing protein [Verrucosispora sp. NA02020]|nr:ATP-binding cassette domain-containing protein [Verrucosispora sp. NA02020]